MDVNSVVLTAKCVTSASAGPTKETVEIPAVWLLSGICLERIPSRFAGLAQMRRSKRNRNLHVNLANDQETC